MLEAVTFVKKMAQSHTTGLEKGGGRGKVVEREQAEVVFAPISLTIGILKLWTPKIITATVLKLTAVLP